MLFLSITKKSKANPKWILAVFGVIAIVLTIIFYKSPVDILPCVLTLVGIYSYWASSTKVTRVGNIVISMCYIIYAIPFKSWFSIICEGYLIINTIVGYCKFESKKKVNSIYGMFIGKRRTLLFLFTKTLLNPLIRVYIKNTNERSLQL